VEEVAALEAIDLDIDVKRVVRIARVVRRRLAAAAAPAVLRLPFGRAAGLCEGEGGSQDARGSEGGGSNHCDLCI
jgi:hypothetical protein